MVPAKNMLYNIKLGIFLIAHETTQKYVIQHINAYISHFFTHYSIIFRNFVVC